VIGDDLVVETKIACGVIAGPVFVATFTALGARRAGYDWRRHAVSSLAVAREGWGQRANFMLVGGLYCVAARGLARSSSRVGEPAVVPALVCAAGVGLIGSGVFVTDPVAGFPAEHAAGAVGATAEVAPTRGGQLHNLCAIPIFVGFLRRPWSTRVLPSAGGNTAGRRAVREQRLAWRAHARCSERHSVVRPRSFHAEVSSSAYRSPPDSDGSARSQSAPCARRVNPEYRHRPEPVLLRAQPAHRWAWAISPSLAR
jgi:hypothetical protein